MSSKLSLLFQQLRTTTTEIVPIDGSVYSKKQIKQLTQINKQSYCMIPNSKKQIKERILSDRPNL